MMKCNWLENIQCDRKIIVPVPTSPIKVSILQTALFSNFWKLMIEWIFKLNRFCKKIYKIPSPRACIGNLPFRALAFCCNLEIWVLWLVIWNIKTNVMWHFVDFKTYRYFERFLSQFSVGAAIDSTEFIVMCVVPTYYLKKSNKLSTNKQYSTIISKFLMSLLYIKPISIFLLRKLL